MNSPNMVKLAAVLCCSAFLFCVSKHCRGQSFGVQAPHALSVSNGLNSAYSPPAGWSHPRSTSVVVGYLTLTVPRAANVTIIKREQPKLELKQKREYRVVQLESYATNTPEVLDIHVQIGKRFYVRSLTAYPGQCFDLDFNRGDFRLSEQGHHPHLHHSVERDIQQIRDDVASIKGDLQNQPKINSFIMDWKSKETVTIRRRLGLELLIPPLFSYREPTWLVRAKHKYRVLHDKASQLLAKKVRIRKQADATLKETKIEWNDQKSKAEKLKEEVEEFADKFVKLEKQLNDQNETLQQKLISATDTQNSYDLETDDGLKAVLLTRANTLHAQVTEELMKLRNMERNLDAARNQLKRKKAESKSAEKAIPSLKKKVQSATRSWQKADDAVNEAQSFSTIVDEIESAIVAVGTNRQQMNSLLKAARHASDKLDK